MKIMRSIILVLSIMLVIFIAASCGDNNGGNSEERSVGQIYLYGETHGVEKIMNRQLEIWRDYYNNENIRNLFVELPYYTAEFLNIWMKSDNDDILNEIYSDIAGTAMHVPYTLVFYQTIKREYPDTIFHGTDVGHQHETTGQRFLEYLENNDLKDSERYRLTQETIDQGRKYYSNSDLAYRVDMMTKNFIREFDKINNKDIMGIYGNAHVIFDFMEQAAQIKGMSDRLRERYGNAVHIGYLFNINIGGKEYDAIYFGEQDLTQFNLEFIKREFWRLENAFEDFKDNALAGDNLPYGNYPMAIETGQIFVIDYTESDGSVTRMYYRSDGTIWQGNPTTVGFTVE